jgi:hypothetical protein
MGSGTPKHFLGLRHLLVKQAEMLARNPANPYAATMNTTIAIITHWMGRGWIERAFEADTPFRVAGEENIEKLKILRLRMLAEDLFNLQYIEGFRELIEGQRKNPNLEAFWAELQIGRLLYINDVDFRFVTPSWTAGLDYDVEILIPGHVICGETKCKASSSILNVKSLTNDIKKAAREQLPKDRPGIVFVAMPQNWFEVDDSLAVEAATISAATDALRAYYVQASRTDQWRHSVDLATNNFEPGSNRSVSTVARLRNWFMNASNSNETFAGKAAHHEACSVE